jgi:hypothetical protein
MAAGQDGANAWVSVAMALPDRKSILPKRALSALIRPVPEACRGFRFLFPRTRRIEIKPRYFPYFLHQDQRNGR